MTTDTQAAGWSLSISPKEKAQPAKQVGLGMDRKTTRHCIKFEYKEFIGEANSQASHGYIFIVVNRKLMTRTLEDYSL